MLTVKKYFFDNEDDLWADIHCNGRRQWYTVVGCDKDDPLYQKVMELDEANETETALRLIEKHCREHGYEKMMAKLPHIEDASKPMQEAWDGADAGDGPFSGAGYYLDDKQFKEEYGMTVEEFDEQIENDIKKYGIDGEIFERRYNDDCLYSVTWWLCEYFTEAVANDYGEKTMEETKYPEQIEIIWTVDDVLDLLVGIDKSGTDVLYRDLGMTRQEAAHVLHEVKEHHDANEGVTWNTLHYWTEELYGDKYKYNGEA